MKSEPPLVKRRASFTLLKTKKQKQCVARLVQTWLWISVISATGERAAWAESQPPLECLPHPRSRVRAAVLQPRSFLPHEAYSNSSPRRPSSYERHDSGSLTQKTCGSKARNKAVLKYEGVPSRRNTFLHVLLIGVGCPARPKDTEKTPAAKIVFRHLVCYRAGQKCSRRFI